MDILRIKKFKSPYFYWHTGNKIIAVISIMLSTLVMWFSLVVAGGFSIWGIIIAVLLDVVGFWIVLIYLLFLRGHIPIFLMGFQSKLDALVLTELVIFVLISIFVSRVSSFYVAKFLGYDFDTLCPYCGKK